jgi:murein DD-endopeptidase MepM/ murein hydrolase activator NlpD
MSRIVWRAAERRLMPFFARDSWPGLPTTHYFLSLSRGDSIRTVMLTPAALWTLIALAFLSLGLGLAGALDLALRDPPGGAIALRTGDADIGDRSSPLAKTGNAEPRRLPEDDALDARLRAVVLRQTTIENRAAVVASLAEALRGIAPAPAARTASDALRAIDTFGHWNGGAPSPADRPALSAARAYAPSAPILRPLRPQARAPLNPLGAQNRASANLSELAAEPDLEPATRLAFVDHSLDRIEGREMSALAAIDRLAMAGADRDAEILGDAGLGAERLASAVPPGTVGGPFVSLDAARDGSAFDRAAARAGRDLAFAAKLRTMMPHMPLGKPLTGATSVASPFGYRIDPFLGRPALHSGVDLVQAYGSEIRAAGAGRVVHAGPMGGYGLMVEIDHGDGLTSRYGHLSETLVGDGVEIDKGAVVGRVGSTGRSTGPHLHYEVRIDGEPVDPGRFLRAGERMTAAE